MLDEPKERLQKLKAVQNKMAFILEHYYDEFHAFLKIEHAEKTADAEIKSMLELDKSDKFIAHLEKTLTDTPLRFALKPTDIRKIEGVPFIYRALDDGQTKVLERDIRGLVKINGFGGKNYVEEGLAELNKQRKQNLVLQDFEKNYSQLISSFFNTALTSIINTIGFHILQKDFDSNVTIPPNANSPIQLVTINNHLVMGTPGTDERIEIPGHIKTVFVHTKNGIELERIETSNTALRDLFTKPVKDKWELQALAQRAKEEEYPEQALKEHWKHLVQIGNAPDVNLVHFMDAIVKLGQLIHNYMVIRKSGNYDQKAIIMLCRELHKTSELPFNPIYSGLIIGFDDTIRANTYFNEENKNLIGISQTIKAIFHNVKKDDAASSANTDSIDNYIKRNRALSESSIKKTLRDKLNLKPESFEGEDLAKFFNALKKHAGEKGSLLNNLKKMINQSGFKNSEQENQLKAIIFELNIEPIILSNSLKLLIETYQEHPDAEIRLLTKALEETQQILELCQPYHKAPILSNADRDKKAFEDALTKGTFIEYLKNNGEAINLYLANPSRFSSNSRLTVSIALLQNWKGYRATIKNEFVDKEPLLKKIKGIFIPEADMRNDSDKKTFITYLEHLALVNKASGKDIATYLNQDPVKQLEHLEKLFTIIKENKMLSKKEKFESIGALKSLYINIIEKNLSKPNVLATITERKGLVDFHRTRLPVSIGKTSTRKKIDSLLKQHHITLFPEQNNAIEIEENALPTTPPIPSSPKPQAVVDAIVIHPQDNVEKELPKKSFEESLKETETLLEELSADYNSPKTSERTPNEIETDNPLKEFPVSPEQQTIDALDELQKELETFSLPPDPTVVQKCKDQLGQIKNEVARNFLLEKLEASTKIFSDLPSEDSITELVNRLNHEGFDSYKSFQKFLSTLNGSAVISTLLKLNNEDDFNKSGLKADAQTPKLQRRPSIAKELSSPLFPHHSTRRTH